MRKFVLGAAIVIAMSVAHAATPLSRVHFSTDTPVLLDGDSRNANQIITHNVGGVIEGAPVLNGLLGTDDIDALVSQAGGRFLFSLRYQKKLGTHLYNPADIIRWDGANYELFFDSNQAGIPLDVNVDAFALLPGNLAMAFSVDRPFVLNGVAYSPADILLFQYSAGFSNAFDASSFGIPETANMTALHLLGNGNFISSFDQGFTLNGHYVKPGSMVEIDTTNTTSEISYDLANIFSLDSGVNIDAFTEDSAVLGSVTDGAFTFQLDPAAGSANADLSFGSGDQLYTSSWFYRSSTDTQEKLLPPPDTAVFNGSQAGLVWFNLDGKLTLTQFITLTEQQPDQQAKLEINMQVSSLDGQAVNYSFFHYVDLDVNTTGSGDSASLFASSPNTILVEDGGVKVSYSGGNNVAAYRVTGYQTLLDELTDTSITNLDNSGLPFSGDFTAGMQWNMSSDVLEANVVLEVNPVTTQPVDCANVTLKDLISNRSVQPGGQLSLDYLDAFIGGIGGNIEVNASNIPATVTRLRIADDQGHQIVAAVSGANQVTSFSTQGDAMPDDTVSSSDYFVYFGIDDTANPGQFIEGNACEFSSHWADPEVTATMTPALPQQGDTVVVDVVLKNVKRQSPGGVNQMGAVSSNSANWVNDVFLAGQGQVTGNLVSYSQVVEIQSANSGDQGDYAITGFGIAGSAAQKVLTIDFDMMFKDGFE
ncbi:MAG: hypothetical protein ACWA5R_12385 [bacterium]